MALRRDTAPTTPPTVHPKTATSELHPSETPLQGKRVVRERAVKLYYAKDHRACTSVLLDVPEDVEQAARGDSKSDKFPVVLDDRRWWPGTQ